MVDLVGIRFPTNDFHIQVSDWCIRIIRWAFHSQTISYPFGRSHRLRNSIKIRKHLFALRKSRMLFERAKYPLVLSKTKKSKTMKSFLYSVHQLH